MNVCTLMGRLCGNPELKTTPEGASVTQFTLAVERGYTSSEGERVVDFIPCVAWRRTAELISRHFQKGQRAAVRGELQRRTYTNKNGEKRVLYEVIVGHVYFCESRPAPMFFGEASGSGLNVVAEELTGCENE